ncbi:hypothetical protein LTR97_007923 [Elasticomyces elasticus]|uniref:HTH La-type RNA-binding domain-containing protein n=1 Tax=Elasticomyces elasticus TaxID=574655 RepID=A0AAN8A0J7_9PEZI|nr:hypothetical protein LTR97_007923 [Elasticomyces elasticus]
MANSAVKMSTSPPIATAHPSQSISISNADPTASQPQLAAHSSAAEILRRVEFYFSDENLPHDAYLLGFAGVEGTNPVSLSLIMGFKKMKQYRPKTMVREVLRTSTVVEVVDNKHIRRREPLTVQPTVTPRIDPGRYASDLGRVEPHLTKNMLKPTGFEPGATEGPITPAQYEKYSPEENILVRLETAVNSFNANRKMHQNTRAIFEKLMIFGGFAQNSHMFQGGMNKKQMKQEGMDKEEIEQATAHYGVTEQVTDAYWKEFEEGEKSSWVVDFEAIAKAFFSSQFLQWFDWTDAKQVTTAAQVLRNFYNYLTLHPVCPEYNDQILAARKVCDLAEQELPKLAIVDRSLPGAFNSACSTLFGGAFANVYISQAAKDSWGHGADNVGLDRDEAITIFMAGLASHGTSEQCEKASKLGDVKCLSEERMGLEVVAVELPSDTVKETYDFLRKREGYSDFIYAMGKLVCKRWDIPFDAPLDLPAFMMEEKADKTQRFEFLVEAETLAFCEPGMKMEAVVKELDLGIKWLDAVEVVYPTFHTWLPNENIMAWKEPGPPTAWMKRQEARKMGLSEEGEGEDVAEEQGDYDEEEPD